jgi:hypothetical protein
MISTATEYRNFSESDKPTGRFPFGNPPGHLLLCTSKHEIKDNTLVYNCHCANLDLYLAAGKDSAHIRLCVHSEASAGPLLGILMEKAA